MKFKKLHQNLPQFLHKYFWDVQTESLDVKKNSFYIMERLMDRGDLKALKWLFECYSKKDLKKVFMKSRNISKFSRAFWAGYLKIYPLKTLCSQKEFLLPQKTAWQY